MKSSSLISYIGVADSEFEQLEKIDLKIFLFIRDKQGSFRLDDNIHRVPGVHGRRSQENLCFYSTFP